MANKIDGEGARNKHNESIKYNSFPLLKSNFVLMGVCGLMIIVGFLLMMGESSGDTFNPDIFSTRRIVVGPTIAFLGFLFMAFALIYKKKDKNDSDNK
ncbi:MAG: DUF3098 domain-containing protein [Muribaculaceae bacterium]